MSVSEATIDLTHCSFRKMKVKSSPPHHPQYLRDVPVKVHLSLMKPPLCKASKNNSSNSQKEFLIKCVPPEKFGYISNKT